MEIDRNLTLEEERRLLLESVAGFRVEVLEGTAREMDESPFSGRVEEAWGRAAAQGLASSLLSEESGGQGMDAYSFCLSLSEIARSSAGFGALLLSHNIAIRALELAGVRDFRRKFLEGREWVSLAWPCNGGDGAARAAFVLGGARAAAFVFPLSEADGARAYCCDRAVASVEGIDSPMGLKAAMPAVVECDLPAGEAPIIPTNKEVIGVESLVLLGVGALATGISREAFDRSRSYARERYQGGDVIINHQQVRLMLSEMLVGFEASRAALACGAGGGSPALRVCRAAKIYACERALSACIDAIQILGGYGYMQDYGLERLMRDAMYLQSYPRSTRAEKLGMLSGE